MSPDERKRIAGRLASLGLIYDKPPKPAMLSMVLDALDDLPAFQVDAFLADWIKTSKLGRLPYPAEIRAGVKPQDDDESSARLAAMRMIGAIRKYGWTDPEGAKAYVGEVGWALVRTLGGWSRFCEAMHDRDIPNLTAQYREACRSLMSAARNGTLDVPPALPTRSRPELQQGDFKALASSLVKRIEEEGL